VDEFHQPDKLPCVSVAVLHAYAVPVFHEFWEHGDGNFDFMIDGVVVDQNSKLWKHCSDLRVEIGNVGQGLSIIVRHTKQLSVAADVLNEFELLDNFPSVSTRATDKTRYAFLGSFHGGRGDRLVFIPKHVVPFAKASPRRNDVDTVIDHPVHAHLQIFNSDGRHRIEIAGIVC
jgi:hypothetical protein